MQDEYDIHSVVHTLTRSWTYSSFHLVISTCSENLARMRSHSHAVGLARVSAELVRFEPREGANRRRVRHD